MSASFELTVNALGDLWIRLSQLDDVTYLTNLDIHILFDNFILKQRSSTVYSIAAPCGTSSYFPYATNMRFVSGDKCTARVLTKFNKFWTVTGTASNPSDTSSGPWISSVHSYIHVDQLAKGTATKLVDSLPISSNFGMKAGVYTFTFDPLLPFVVRIGQSSAELPYNVTQFAQFADRNVAKDWAELCFSAAIDRTPNANSALDLRFDP